jgi:hypothetical protein
MADRLSVTVRHHPRSPLDQLLEERLEERLAEDHNSQAKEVALLCIGRRISSDGHRRRDDTNSILRQNLETGGGGPTSNSHPSKLYESGGEQGVLPTVHPHVGEILCGSSLGWGQRLC